MAAVRGTRLNHINSRGARNRCLACKTIRKFPEKYELKIGIGLFIASIIQINNGVIKMFLLFVVTVDVGCSIRNYEIHKNHSRISKNSMDKFFKLEF